MESCIETQLTLLVDDSCCGQDSWAELTCLPHRSSDTSSGSLFSRPNQSQYPWLIASNELCHSDNQIASGMDLSNVKKKYKKMFCLWCAEFNPNTPWAHLKARKFESDVFTDHERSVHHRKALFSRQAAGSSALSSNPHSSIPSFPLADSLLVSKSATTSSGSSSILPHSVMEVAPLALSNPLPSVSSSSHSMSLSSQSADSLTPDTPRKSEQSMSSDLSAIYDHALRPRQRFTPDWLRVQGQLSFSERQLTSGADLSRAKRKYRMMMCADCAEFNPTAAWASMRPRKFEQAVLADHETSLNHRKALQARTVAVAQGACF